MRHESQHLVRRVSRETCQQSQSLGEATPPPLCRRLSSRRSKHVTSHVRFDQLQLQEEGFGAIVESQSGAAVRSSKENNLEHSTVAEVGQACQASTPKLRCTKIDVVTATIAWLWRSKTQATAMLRCESTSDSTVPQTCLFERKNCTPCPGKSNRKLCHRASFLSCACFCLSSCRCRC